MTLDVRSRWSSRGEQTAFDRSAAARCGEPKGEYMKKQRAARAKIRRRVKRDTVLAEFERRDLGRDIRTGGVARLLRRRAKPTSIVLDDELVTKLKEKGAHRGLGYQTMLKLIVREHIDAY